MKTLLSHETKTQTLKRGVSFETSQVFSPTWLSGIEASF